MLLGIDEVNEILNELAEELPPALTEGLTGGINLLEEEKHPEIPGGDELFYMGEYCTGPLGCYVVLYYGSFAAVYGNAPRRAWVKQLRRTLRHELTHHMEHRAGVRDLEIKDEIEMERYLRRGAGAEENDG